MKSNPESKKQLLRLQNKHWNNSTSYIWTHTTKCAAKVKFHSLYKTWKSEVWVTTLYKICNLSRRSKYLYVEEIKPVDSNSFVRGYKIWTIILSPFVLDCYSLVVHLLFLFKDCLLNYMLHGPWHGKQKLGIDFSNFFNQSKPENYFP